MIPPTFRRRRSLMSRAGVAVVTSIAVMAACLAPPTPSESPDPTPSAPATPSPSPSSSASPIGSPTPTPEPPLSLEPPAARDERVITLQLTPEVRAGEGGRIVVRVTNASDARIDELALRWPTDLAPTLFLAPFVPSSERIREGGSPLVQPWTRWVVGPGERGEPAGTTTLGYGPIDAGATLTIPIYVTRRAPGPVGFDLQVLAGEALLSLEASRPADVRVNLP